MNTWLLGKILLSARLLNTGFMLKAAQLEPKEMLLQVMHCMMQALAKLTLSVGYFGFVFVFALLLLLLWLRHSSGSFVCVGYFGFCTLPSKCSACGVFWWLPFDASITAQCTLVVLLRQHHWCLVVLLHQPLHWCLRCVLVVAFWRQHHCTLVVLLRQPLHFGCAATPATTLMPAVCFGGCLLTPASLHIGCAATPLVVLLRQLVHWCQLQDHARSSEVTQQ